MTEKQKKVRAEFHKWCIAAMLLPFLVPLVIWLIGLLIGKIRGLL